MKTNSTKSNHKFFSNKHIWPTIVFSSLILMVMIFTVTFSVHYVISYVIENKIDKISEQTYRVALMIEQKLLNGKDISEAIIIRPQNSDFLLDNVSNEFNEIDIYVTDMTGNKLACTGDNAPLLNDPILLSLSKDYHVYSDTSDVLHKSLEELANTSWGDILEWSLELGPDRNAHNDKWLTDVIIKDPFWIGFSLNDSGYIVYIRCFLTIVREEFVHITMASIVALVLLGAPLIFILFNTIAAIIRQRKLTKLLYTDSVTGAPNWMWFLDMTEKTSKRKKFMHIFTRLVNSILLMFSKKEIGRTNYALIDLQLQRYSNYCACSGVKEGEELLYRISEFLKARLQGKTIFCRHSNADFAILMPCVGEDKEALEKYCNHKLRILLAELTGLPAMQKLQFHAGVYMIEDMSGKKDLDCNQLFTFAKYALDKASSHNVDQIYFFDSQMLEEQTWLKFVEENMEEALENEQFQVYLQPKYCPETRRLVAAEALVRWKHPEKGMVSPGLFIPIFEENGFITKLDDYMITKLAKMQAEWTLQKKKQVPISVNVSRAHFSLDDLADHICRLVDAYGASHELIELEVTESAFFDDKDVLTDTVKALKERGFSISMDDFGAGYSSLNSLKDIPIDILKLDGEFFRGSSSDDRGKTIIKEVIQLAKLLKLKIVAEGVEKEDQVDFLTEMGCDMIQGFYFAKPMPADVFEELVEKDA